MRLYSFWRSSCSYRARIALGLKGLDWETVPVHLPEGDQHDPSYAAINASNLVPTLELPDGTRLTQSLAIIDWLDSIWPDPPLLPADPLAHARVQAASHIIAMDVQPVTNSGVINVLHSDLGASTEAGIAWMIRWMAKGFAAYQASIEPDGPFAFGKGPTLADICLIPQLYNARRWGVDLAPFARLTNIENHCLALPAFDAARPENQPDADI